MVPVVVQDVKTDAVLMVAYMNEEAYNQTLRTGHLTYYSRSRSELWLKGETSGHYPVCAFFDRGLRPGYNRWQK